MLIRSDCLHFRGDRPCAPHKRTGVHCDVCAEYTKTAYRILIVKLDAIGDVLRTTCILTALHKQWPASHVTWLTRQSAKALFNGNPHVHRVETVEAEAWISLATEQYDLVINLDSSPVSARLATMANAERKFGFGYDPRGFVFPFNKEAREWFEMGLFDDRKLQNEKTYQTIAHEICQLDPVEQRLHLYLNDDEREWAKQQRESWGGHHRQPVIGLNTGASDRWPHKKWTLEGYVELINGLYPYLQEKHGVEPLIVLLGGESERERNKEIVARTHGRSVDARTDRELRRFFALLELCDLVVTGDTLGMHAACALDKFVVAIFGPTSITEIDLYGRGVKLVSDAPCVGSYLSDCDVTPTCMERISSEQVQRAVLQLLGYC